VRANAAQPMGFLSSFGTNLGATVEEFRSCFRRRARQGSSESGQFQGRDQLSVKRKNADAPCPPTRACGPEGLDLRKTWQAKPNQGAKETTAVESYPERFRSKHKTDAFRTRLARPGPTYRGHNRWRNTSTTHRVEGLHASAFLFYRLASFTMHATAPTTSTNQNATRLMPMALTIPSDPHGQNDTGRQQQTTGYGESPMPAAKLSSTRMAIGMCLASQTAALRQPRIHRKVQKEKRNRFAQGPISYIMLTRSSAGKRIQAAANSFESSPSPQLEGGGLFPPLSSAHIGIFPTAGLIWSTRLRVVVQTDCSSWHKCPKTIWNPIAVVDSLDKR